MEKSQARKELNMLLEAQKKAGMRRRDICLLLFNKGLTEREAGIILSVNAKTCHAFKVNFSKAAKEKQAKTKKRVHYDLSKVQPLKRIDGKKLNAIFFQLVEKVLTEEEQSKEKTNA